MASYIASRHAQPCSHPPGRLATPAGRLGVHVICARVRVNKWMNGPRHDTCVCACVCVCVCWWWQQQALRGLRTPRRCAGVARGMCCPWLIRLRSRPHPVHGRGLDEATCGQLEATSGSSHLRVRVRASLWALALTQSVVHAQSSVLELLGPCARCNMIELSCRVVENEMVPCVT